PQTVQCVASSMEQGTDRGPSLSYGRGAAHVGSGLSSRVSGNPRTASCPGRARPLHWFSCEDRSAERGRGPGSYEPIITSPPTLCRRRWRRRCHDDFAVALDHLDVSIAARRTTCPWAAGTLS